MLKSSLGDCHPQPAPRGPAAHSCRGGGFIRARARFQKPDAPGASQLLLVASSLLCPRPLGEAAGVVFSLHAPDVGWAPCPVPQGTRWPARGATEPCGAPGLPLGAASSLLWAGPGSLPLDRVGPSSDGLRVSASPRTQCPLPQWDSETSRAAQPWQFRI